MAERITEGWGQKVAGRCPACGNGSLFVAAGQHVTCSALECPDPTVVADFLQRPGPRRHVVEFRADGWALEHTLRCRLDGLTECAIHRALDALDAAPFAEASRHEVTLDRYGLHYWPIKGADGG